MRAKTERALALLGVAIVLGVSGDLLRSWVPGRLDVALWVTLFLVTAAVLVRARALPEPPQAAWLSAMAWLLVSSLIWRDAPALFGLNLLGLVGLLAIGAPGTAMRSIDRLGVLQLARGSVLLGAETVGGPLSAVVRDVAWAELPLTSRTRRIGGVLAGFAAAIPVLVVFGALFGEADPLFRQAIDQVFGFDPEHLLFIGFVAWIAAGALRGAFWREGRGPARDLGAGGQVPAGLLVGFVGGIAALFALFVGFQARELFLDSAQFQTLTGVTIAEYARGGFFELLWVAILTLPLLLGADWLLARGDPAEIRRFRRITAAALVLLAPVLASAVHRMVLYVSYYGLTSDRFYALAFMGWLGVVFAWFAITVLRGQRSRFVPGALAGAYGLLLLLNIGNPDGVIAGVNLRRAAAGAPLDVSYVASLSADAVPEILAVAPSLPTPDRCALSQLLQERHGTGTAKGGATAVWNLSRRSTRRLLQASEPAGADCTPGGPSGDQGTEARL